MTILRHELRQGRKSFWVWTLSIVILLVVCIFLFPEMKGEMDGVTEMFASMGSFTKAFGMDRLNFGTFIGFYVIECGNILGLGGAFFAALLAISSLAKEEKDRTAEFLLSHPVGRFRIVAEKLAAVMAQIVGMNLVILALSAASVVAIGETIPLKEMGLLHLAFLLMQMELAGICFGISAFLRRGSLGMGLGLAVMLYFLNIIANLTEGAKFLKYFTPFGYTEGADILEAGALKTDLVLLGMGVAVLGIALAFSHYCKKDIQ